MIDFNYLYPLSAKWMVRRAFLMLLPGVITILCHGGSPFDRIEEVITLDVSRVYADAVGHYPALTDKWADDTGTVKGPPPDAEDDFANTSEETPVTVNVLANDRSREEGGRGDDDDDDDDFRIDRSTVDLDVSSWGRQSFRQTSQGTFTVNDDGYVTYSPALNFFGEASIQYTVESHEDESLEPATVRIHVSNVNDAPVITGLRRESLEARAAQPLSMTPDDFFISDPDGHPAADFTIIVVPGSNYSASGNTVTVEAGYSGSLPVQVRVSDGISSSDPFPVQLLVTAENQPPEITGQHAVTTQEDQAITIIPAHLVIEDPDNPDVESFSVQVAAGTNYTVSGQTVTPSPDYFGTLSVPVTVSDGQSTSGSFNLQVSVASVNDAPVITGQQSLSTAQGTPITLTLGHLIVNDPDHSYPEGFSLSVLPGTNYTVSGQAITPAAEFSGSLTVSVTVSDPLVSSQPFPLQVNVAANARPVISGQSPLSTQEGMALALSLSNLTVSDPDDTYPTGFTLKVMPGANYTVAGTTITPTGNFFGTLTVPVVVNDGSAESEPFQVQVSVINVNDPPVITGQVALSTPEGQPITLALSHLQVADPDDLYPDVFSLVILSGSNYAVSGNVVTPAPGFNGTLSVGVMVNDGEANSEVFPVQIAVTPVNDPPVITGQRPLEMTEGGAITLSLQDLTVSDSDNIYPEGFALTVQPGQDYTVSGTTVTPAENFNGVLGVTVTVNDGQASSAPFVIRITVIPQNDPPQVVGPVSLSTNEDVPFSITLSDLQVLDPDNVYPTGFSVVVLPGANYTLTGNTVTPAKDYFGPLQVDVQVSDGTLTSNIFPIAVQVQPVNDAPVITGQVPVETGEDTPVTLQLSHLTVLDVDNSYPSGFSISILPGSNYSVSGNTVTPSLDYNGTLNVNVTVSDGVNSSASFLFQIQVGNANDAPAITGQATVATNEETPFTLQLSHLTVTDPDNPYPSGFQLLASPGTNYTVSGTTVTPVLNFAGVLTIPVRVNDGINNSATFDFKLQVNQINDAPQFAAIPNQRIAENTAAGSVTIREISKGPQEDYQQLTFVATSGNTAVIPDPVVQYGGGTTATLSYSVTPNTSGVVTITVVAIDNGSNTPPHKNSYSSSFQVEVVEINDSPTLDPVTNIVVLEDAEQQIVNLTGISAGPGEAQTLSVSVSVNKPELFETFEVTYASPESTGALRFKPKANANGTTSVSVTVADNGSGISPHVNSVTRMFSIEIKPVNDPPRFTSQPVTVAVANEVYGYAVRVLDPDGENVTITATQKPAWAVLAAVKGGEAVLKGIPPTGALGNVDITLQAKDASGVVDQKFTLYVNVRPAIIPLSLTAEEDTPVPIHADFFESGYTDENGNPLEAIVVTSIPASGSLSIESVAVAAGDTLQRNFLEQLIYTPDADFFGPDAFAWKAFDGHHFSRETAQVDVSVVGVNDAPVVVFESDTLRYEVNGEPALLFPQIDIVDVDDDSLHSATIALGRENYYLEADLLEFPGSPTIRGSYEFQSGILQLTGQASIDEYRSALRSITYLYRNTIDPLLEPKTVGISLHDGDIESARAQKIIMLQYTFVEFEIPSGFTPNGDQANDTWIIDRPGGGLEEMGDAVISIYNKHGVLVFQSRGFERAWDGTFQGELLPADTYFYTIDLQLRSGKTYKGVVTILR